MFDAGVPPTVLFLAYPGSLSDCDRDLKSSLNIKSQAEVSCGVPWGGQLVRVSQQHSCGNKPPSGLLGPTPSLNRTKNIAARAVTCHPPILII